MNVLIICNDFPPLNSIGAQRPFSWYRHFKKYGITTTVITKNWYSSQLPNQSIIEKSEYGLLIKVPVQKKLPDRFIEKYGENKYVQIRKFLTFVYLLLSFVTCKFDKHIGLYRTAVKHLNSNKIDAIITSGEPFILFKYGYKLKKTFPAIKWIADYRDSWYNDHVKKLNTKPLNKFLRRYEYYFEKKYLKIVNLITTVDPYLTEELSKIHNKRAKLIYNGFDEFIEMDYNNHNISNKLTLAHTGTLTPGQRVEFLLTAVKNLMYKKVISEQDIEIRFIGIEHFKDQMKRVLNFEPVLKNIIKTTPRLSRYDALTINAGSDYLIALTDKSYSAIYAKVYDYLSAKRPVLVIPGDNKLMDDFIKSLNAGYIFNNLNELENFIMENINKKKTGSPVSQPKLNVEKAKFYTRENQAAKFVELLKAL